MSDDPGRRDVFRLPGFARFWAAEAVSEFGTYVTTIALQVLVVLTLGGAAFEVGLVNAARFLPYLLLGFVVGALVDRRRRKPVLVSTDLARAVLLCSIPLLWLLGWLSLPTLIAVVIVFGVMSLFNDAATQSYLPRLVPKWALVPANARLGQSSAVAQTTGPLAGGGLVGLIGAPLAVLVDAVTYLVSAVLTATIPLIEPEPERGKPLTLRKDIVEGLRWVYRHRTLAPLSVSAHVWFLANGMGGAIFVPLVLLVLGFGPLELGVMVAVAGGFALIGASVSTWAGRRLGAGPAIILTRVLYPLGWVLMLFAAFGAGWPALVLVAVAQALIGFAMGADNPNEMGFRQAVTPDALQGRVNTSMRSVNRTMIVIGAPLGGLLADRLGYPIAIGIVIAIFTAALLVLLLSPFRTARHHDE